MAILSVFPMVLKALLDTIRGSFDDVSSFIYIFVKTEKVLYDNSYNR